MAKYVQIGKLVEYKILVTIGSTFVLAVGADTTFSVPVSYKSDYVAFTPIGQLNILHSGTTLSYGLVAVASPATNQQGVLQLLGNSTIITTKPFDSANITTSTADTLLITGSYEAP